MKPFKAGFVGFGEAASIFSAAMVEHGAEVAAYDILLERPNGQDVLLGRRRAEAVRFLPLAELVSASAYILSTVTSDVAEQAARTCAPYLRPGQVYVDLNATSPAVKLAVRDIVQAAGADFVEGAVLGAVGVSGAKTRILSGGPVGADAAARLSQAGLNVAFYSPEVGKASTYKLLRSVFSKGLEALLLEFLIAGRRAGLQEDLWQEVVSLFREHRFEDVAANWVRTHATAHKRRHHEMVQVSELLLEIGVDSLMTEATERLFQRSCTLGLDQGFPTPPEEMQDVIAWMAQHAAHGNEP